MAAEDWPEEEEEGWSVEGTGALEVYSVGTSHCLRGSCGQYVSFPAFLHI